MRVTSSMYYESLYGNNNSKLNKKLFDVNKQIASGLKIQYASDDVATFTETMRLDNEITTLGQIKQSTESGYKISNQSDVILNDFEGSMNRIRTLLINAANDTNSNTSRDAIAAELRGLEKHLKNLSNTSINGQYLFSGSAVDIKPINDDGTYNGNDVAMNAFLGSNSQQQYNLTGADLFLGEEILVKREVTTNAVNSNLIAEYPILQGSADIGVSTRLTSNNTIRDLMGDTDNATIPANDHYFYIRGVKSDGTAFNQKIEMQDDDKIDELLTQIGNAYGNTPNLDLVNVSLNSSGQVVIEDKIKGSSKLDFHMVGAVDFSGVGAADVLSIDSLDGGETNFDLIVNPVVAPQLYVKEFVKSPYSSSVATISNIDGLLYDRTEFTKDGSKLSSNVSQIVRDTNAFATPSTKISEVADLSQGTAGTLDGTQLLLAGFDVNGNAFAPPVQIDFFNTANGGSTFSFDGGVTNYSIFDMNTTRSAVNADDMTYQQLMDVVNMALTGNIPATTATDGDYDQAISSSNFMGGTYLHYDGKIQFEDMLNKDTLASVSIYDSNSGTFTDLPATTDSSVLSFNSNNSLTVRDPKTDFFTTIDEMITAVENYKNYPDSTSGEMRNVGIQNAITMMDDLQDHVFRTHSTVGAQSNTLTDSLERTELLEISTMTLRSSVIDTDLAEASLELTQLTINYEAMLSTVGRVSQLSLVNYL